MNKKLFGYMPGGEEVSIYTLTWGSSYAEFTDYGASIVSFLPFGKTDVIGGFDCFEHYLTDSSNQGAIIGRVANRIENAQFSIGNRTYHLTDNDNGNCLHSGTGFQHRLWKLARHTQNSITFSYYSPDGEDGFPSALSTEVTYTLCDNSIIISYWAVPDGDTPIALTNHAYFNLNGFGEDIKNHYIQIWAEKYSRVNEKLIPDGNHPSVDSTPLDMRNPRRIGDAINDSFAGYDHNMILSPVTYKSFQGTSLGLAARAEGESLILNVYTNQQGLQFYTGNFLGNGPDFKNKIPQIPHGAFCLEAQTEPNCINRNKAIYSKGQEYLQLTVYEFLEK